METPHPIPPRKPSTGSGFFIIASIFTGTAIGYVLYQPTIGFLVGTALGIGVAGVLAWRER
jgi:hypothetical protein